MVDADDADSRLLDTLQRLLAIEAPELRPALTEACTMVAEGLTNAEIGHRLSIVEGTVANHVEHILRKLGPRGRTQVAVWAVEHGLYHLGQEQDEPEV